MSEGDQPLLHSIRAAAARLGEVSESTIWRLIRAGKLRPVKTLGRTLIPASELQRLAQEGAVPIPESNEPSVPLHGVQDAHPSRRTSRRGGRKINASN
jgi:excisionase family DNA binding protein